MTQPAWPFVLPKPAGYVNTVDVPTAAELNLNQEQVAVAADGRLYTDLAVVKNWQLASPVNVGQHLAYDRARRRWLSFSEDSNDLVSAYSISGVKWTSLGIAGLSPAVSTNGVLAAASDPSGVVLVGLGRSSATANKIVESTDGAATWTQRAIGASDGSQCVGLAYSTALGLWIGSKNNAGGGEPGIWTSPDRITWTKRATFTAGAFVVRESPTPFIIGWGTGTGGTSYFTSSDALSWSSVTGPADTGASAQGGYSDALGVFVMALSSGVYTSPTGLTATWTLKNATGTMDVRPFGRLLVRGNGEASLDGGTTWLKVADVTSTYRVLAVSDRGVMLSNATNDEHLVSLQIGF